MPAKAPKIKYKVPMSLWFVEKSHRFTQLFTAENVVVDTFVIFLFKVNLFNYTALRA
jgi:hypothetical protein